MFRCLIISKRLLSKVFLSTKGVYYEAHLGMNVKVVWIEPYSGTTVLPVDVDYKMLLTFAHFHQSLLKFVLAKLYSLSQLNFPPKLVDESSLTDTNVEIIKPEKTDEPTQIIQKATFGRFLVEKSEKTETQGPETAEIDPEFQNDETIQKMMDWNKETNTKMFDNFVFFISREVRTEIFEFVSRSFGAKVIYHSDNFESKEYQSQSITHVITDRKMEHLPQEITLQANREFVQPQWILDSINFGALLNIKDYIPGKPLPPHLSPFEGKKREGFLSEREKEVMKQLGREIDLPDDDEYSEMSGDEDGMLEEEQLENEQENLKAQEEQIQPADLIEESENESDFEEEVDSAGIEDGGDKIAESSVVPEQVFSKKLKRNRLNVKKEARYKVKAETGSDSVAKKKKQLRVKKKIEKEQQKLAASQLSRKKRKIYEKLNREKEESKKEVKVLKARQRALKKKRGIKK